jgi:hypothetical protein
MLTIPQLFPHSARLSALQPYAGSLTPLELLSLNSDGSELQEEQACLALS